jgi:tetratricopeptide (TPR) repeat protein
LTRPRGINEDAPPVEASSDTRGWRERAEEHFARRDYRASHEAALEGLSADPDDLDALRLAGRSGVEIEAEDAVAQLQRVAELVPDDIAAWRDLGDALAAEGRTAEAEAAWKKLAELRPDDSTVLTSLGHAALAAGHTDEAAERLTAAAQADTRNLSASMSLVDVYRDMGQPTQALDIARRIWDTDKESILAGLDVAELSAATGDYETADKAYDRLLELDDEGHEAFIRYGQLAVALKREQWIQASALASSAARLEQSARSQRLLAYFADRAISFDRNSTSPDLGAALLASQSGVFALPNLDQGPPEVPSLDEVERLLDDARFEHRRIHIEEGTAR